MPALKRRINRPILCLLFLVSATAWAELDKDRVAAVDDFIQPFAEFGMFDGSVLIDVGGDIVYEQSFGHAQIEFGIRHNPTTRFRIASVSKAITDAAIARLVASGELDVDAPLSDFLPDFPRASDIRVSHLLEHRSGVPHTNRQPWGDGSLSKGIDEIIARLAELPLDFEPGSDYRYSNGGYALLAKIIGVITGSDYGGAMQRMVFDPLGMTDSGHVYDSRRPIARMATGYQPGLRPGERRLPRFYAVESRPGGGSLYSSARDLRRFMHAVFREDFIPDGQRNVVMGFDGEHYLSQGRSPGFIAKAFFDAPRDMIVISLSNNYAVPDGWAAAIADLASGRTASSPWPATTPAAPTVAADDLRIGDYRSSFGDFRLSINRDADGYLILKDEIGDSNLALIPLAGDAFLQPQYYQRCTQDAETRIITCRMLSGNERYTSVLTPDGDTAIPPATN